MKDQKDLIPVIASILDCGYLDAKYLVNEILPMCELYNIEIEDLKERLSDMGYEKQLTCNDLIFAGLDFVFYQVMADVEEHLNTMDEDVMEDKEAFEQYLKDLKDNFSPFINSIDSWFSNCFDDIELTGIVEDDMQLLYKKFKES